jgi:hypothetical protein
MLGNHKYHVWSKSDQFAPVLHGDSLCFLVSLVIQKQWPLGKVIAKILLSGYSTQ